MRERMLCNREMLCGSGGRTPGPRFAPALEERANDLLRGLATLCAILTIQAILLVISSAQDIRLIIDEGHSLPVEQLVFSPDGSLLASAGNDGKIKLWEPFSAQEVMSIGAHEGATNSIAFSPDGRRLASGGGDALVKIWDLKDGREILSLSGHKGDVRGVSYSPDGHLLASGGGSTFVVYSDSGKFQRNPEKGAEANSRGYEVIIWNAENGERVATLGGFQAGVTSVSFSPNGSQLVTGSLDRTVRIWDTTTWKEIRNLEGNAAGVFSIAWSPDGELVASGAGDGTVRLWDAKTGEPSRTIEGDSRIVRNVQFSPDGQVIAGAELWNGSVSLWNIDSGKRIRKFGGFRSGTQCVAFTPDGKHIAISYGLGGDWNPAIEFFETASGNRVSELRSLAQIMQRSAANREFDLFANGANWNINVWSAKRNGIGLVLKGHKDVVLSVEFSEDSSKLLSAGADRTARIWDLSTGQVVTTFAGHSGSIKEAVFSPDEKLVATASTDQTVRIWDSSNGKQLGMVRDTVGGFSSVVFTPDGSRLIAGDEFGTGGVSIFVVEDVLRAETEQLPEGVDYDVRFRWWDEASGPGQRTLTGFQYAWTPVAVSPDGSFVAGGDAFNKKVRIWRVLDKVVVKELDCEVEPFSLSFSPDGRLLAVGEKNVVVWDVATGSKAGTLVGHVGPVPSVNFNSEGTKLFTSSWDKGARIWNMKSGTTLASLINLGESDWAAITDEGRFDASPGALEAMHYAYGREIIGLDQLKAGYYEPGLLSKVLGFSRQPLRTISPLKDVKLFPEVLDKEFDPASGLLSFRIKARTGGVGAVQVLVNGKLAVPDARSGELISDPLVPPGSEISLRADLSGSSFRKGEENQIDIITSNYIPELGTGNIHSRGVRVSYADKREKEFRLPTLYAIVGGISDYTGDAIDLNFASKDAEDFAAALSVGARRLFCSVERPDCIDKVRVTTLSSSGKEGTIAPTKENFKDAFASIAKEALPDDIVVVYLAGHGMAMGKDTYFFLTREARSASVEVLKRTYQSETISSEELTNWLTQTEWVEGQKGNMALKHVLILDTCAAESAAPQLALVARRDLSSDQIRALEFLKDKTGTFVLMGSAATAASYEASQFGQGLLTRSLLEGMKGAALDSDRIDVSKLFAYAERRVPNLATRIGQVQQPVISVPSGRSFPIGIMKEPDRALIALPSEKPFVGRPTLRTLPVNNDPLGLEAELARRLEDESSFEVMSRVRGRNDTDLVYVDSSEFPGALKITGTYVVMGDRVTIRAYVTRDQEVLSELPAITGTRANVLDLLLEEFKQTTERSKGK